MNPAATPDTPPPAATALVAEDEPLLAAALVAELRRGWPGLHIVAQVGDGLAAAAQALALRPQVCFLDIRMPGQSGLDAAQALAEDWPDDGVPLPLLVFVTAYDQYALAAFDAQAADYLVKPVQPARLARCIARLQQRLRARQPSIVQPPSATAPAAAAAATTDATADPALAQLRALLAAHAASAPPVPRLEVVQAAVGTLVHLVPVAEVLYFEAADKYLRVVTAEREHLIRLSLKELLPQLDPQVFWQVHRGLVVRASAIRTAQRDDSGKVYLHLRDRPERLTASRLYAHLFKGM